MRCSLVPLVALSAVCVLSGALIAPAHAQIVTFSGSDAGVGPGDPRPQSDGAAAAFDSAAAAIGTGTLVTFENAPVGSFTNLTVAPGVSINGTDYTGAQQSVQNAPQGTPVNLYGYNTTAGGANYVFVLAGDVTFTFAQPIQYFGAYFTGIQNSGQTVNFNDGTPRSLVLPNVGDGATFFGFTDIGASITSITINTRSPVNGGGDFIGIDDVRFGPAAVTPGAVPEPSEWLAMGMAGTSLGGLMVRARVRRRRQSALAA
ncbi:MAG: hypothetical protein V4671_17870 [Armatimonadota bacterium]